MSNTAAAAILSCDMVEGCTAPVTHLDRKGYAYCTAHGLQRRAYQPCRKLQPWELRRLQAGKPLARY